jgi:glycosyltransferase involved in cell wall biosynthesis
MEWIIIDDGTDKIEDLVKDIPQVKYFKYEEKLTLGKKRNISHEKTCGDIIIYMDDDDYYPPERVSHAVEMLEKNPTILCAGLSILHIFFKHVQKMYQFGPYGDNHSTAASFAFRKKLLEITSFDELACLAEEKHFLKNYTIPLIQLDPLKTILVFSHIHNSCDKKILLEKPENSLITESPNSVLDFVKNELVLKYFMEDIDSVLEAYEPGKPENKVDVLKQIEEKKEKREADIKEQQYKRLLKAVNETIAENTSLKKRIAFLEEKIRSMIVDSVKNYRN